MGKDVVSTLNEFLAGQYMGIHAYEHFIEKIEDPTIKKQFQIIQQEHKQHAMKVAERIQNLGGTPVDDEGIIGSIQGFMGKFMIPDEMGQLIAKAKAGEDYYGVHVSEKIVQGELDQEGEQLIKEILDSNREHIRVLDGLVH